MAQLSDIPENRLYSDLAWLWPILSPPEGYAEEAAFWRRVLRDRLGPGRHEILELGVGGGNNLSHLTDDFKATAVDLSEKMLEHSRRLNPDVEHHVGDMRHVRLDRTFRAVIIHDAIAYMVTPDDLRACIRTAHGHLRPGGIFVTAPDYLEDFFASPHLYHTVEKKGDTAVTLFQYTFKPDPSDTRAEVVLTYIIRQGADLRVELDRHHVGIFSLAQWRDLMDEGGFDMETEEYPVHEDNRQAYLLVGTKRN